MIRQAIPLLPLLLAGCAEVVDPYQQPGNWRPAGVNEQNLRVMAARPEEIVRGTGDPGSPGHGATDAVARLRTDRVRPLPESTIVRLGSGTN